MKRSIANLHEKHDIFALNCAQDFIHLTKRMRALESQSRNPRLTSGSLHGCDPLCRGEARPRNELVVAVDIVDKTELMLCVRLLRSPLASAGDPSSGDTGCSSSLETSGDEGVGFRRRASLRDLGAVALASRCRKAWDGMGAAQRRNVENTYQ